MSNFRRHLLAAAMDCIHLALAPLSSELRRAGIKFNSGLGMLHGAYGFSFNGLPGQLPEAVIHTMQMAWEALDDIPQKTFDLVKEGLVGNYEYQLGNTDYISE
jgi:hypothetical protein